MAGFSNIFLIFCGFFFVFPVKTSAFKRLVVFGGCLSDDGIDVTDDFHGFARISNGPIWSEYLAKRLDLSTENYAYNGAKSGFGNYHHFGNWSGVLWQVDKYFCVYDTVPVDTLVVLQAGGIFDLAPSQRNERTVAKNARQALDLLAEKAAENVLVIGLPDAAKIPGFSRRSEGYLIAGLVTQANSLIRSEVEAFKQKNQGIKVWFLDLAHAWWDIEQKFGKTEEVFPSYRDQYWAIDKDRYQAEYMWYTEYHPTTSVHKMIADKAYEVIDSCDS